MGALVADTHVAVWYLVEPQRLSPTARAVLEQTAHDGEAIYISAISIVEVCYLAEKGRLAPAILQRLKSALEDSSSALVVVSLDYGIATTVERISRTAVSDMPDRIIAATALRLNLPLVTRDRQIRAAGINTIW
jgi:PIN domain nuclease of toxin-antitoxin system